MNTSSEKTININLTGPLTLLTVAFIALKLTHHIDWSWLWVLSPLWLPIAAVFGFIAMTVVFLVILACSAVVGAAIAGARR